MTTATEKTVKTETAKAVSAFMKEGKDGLWAIRGENIVFNRDSGHGRLISDTLVSMAGRVMGRHTSMGYGKFMPMKVFMRFMDDIDMDYISDHVTGAVSELIESAREYREAARKDLDDKLSKGALEVDDLPVYFDKGMEVIFTVDGKEVGAIVENCTIQYGFFSQYVEVHGNVIHSITGEVAEGAISTRFSVFEGLRPLDTLPVRKITDDEKKRLTKRGKLWASMVGRAAYMMYSGQLEQNSWYGSKSFRSEGRIIVDPRNFSRVDSDQYRHEQRHAGLEAAPQNETKTARKVKDEELWRTYPFVWGFSMAAKMWGRLAVDDITPINWRDDAFDKLVLPEREKQLVRSVVEHSGDSFSDIVEGKGGGSIFLLHGPPGQGKTLTAETVAEALRKPLYSISVGQLGTNPDVLEKRLREILDVAMTWDAVLLLDEADIFLEERTEHDVLRNAMVGVFLRLLEYHQGVLFLTTNRVKNIDRAFYSRISVALRFGVADATKRRQIWQNLLESAGLDSIGLDLDVLAGHDINGRQIKNVIRLTQTLAKAEGREIDVAMVSEVIDLTTSFHP